MKTKLTLFILALLCSVGAWADVTVNVAKDNTNGPQQYGTGLNNTTNHPDFSSQSPGVTLQTTWTSNAASGLAGLTVSTSSATLFSQDNVYSIKGFCLHPTAVGSTETVTITAPSGYYIKGYSLNAASWNSAESYTLSAEGVTSVTTSNTAWKTFSVTNQYNTASTSFTVTGTGSSNARYLIVTSFSVTLVSTTMTGTYSLNINSTTGDKYRDGESTPTTSTNDFRKYQSTSSPAGLTLVTGSGNSMNFNSTTGMKLHSNGGTYTITAPEGYYIKGYKMSSYTSENKKNTIQPAGATKILISEDSSNPTYIFVDDIYASSTTFTRAYETGGGADYAITNMTVYLEPLYTITYYVVDESGETVAYASVTDLVTNPATPSLPTSISNDYCTYGKFYDNSALTGEAVTGPISTNTTLYVGYSTNTATCPFEFSADYASAKWYYMTLRDYWVLYDSSTPWYFESTQSKADKAQWAFVGDPYSFTIINKEAGSGYYMKTNGTSATDYPTMETTGTSWTLGTHPVSGYTIYYGTNNHLYAGDNAGRKFLRVLTATLTSSNDGVRGGSFTFEAVPDNFYSYVVSNVAPYMNNLGEYFGLNTSASGYSAMKTNYDGYVAAESCTQAEYEELYDYVSTLSNYNLPPSGYYRIKNYKYQTYYINAASTNLSGSTANTSASTLVYLTKSDNTYTMQMQGKYLQTPATSENVTLSTGSISFTPSIGSGGWASFNAGGGANGNLHMDKDYNIVGWEANNITANDGSYWSIEPATDAIVSMNQAGTDYYASLCLPFDATISDATAYTLEKSGNYLVPTEVTDNKVPAGTPVLLKGTNATATATINTGDAFNGGSPLSCALTGTYTATTIVGANDYVLGKDGDNVGFYHWNSNNLAANRAYLQGAAGVKGFVLMFDDDDATSIGSIQNSKFEIQNGAEVYNLSGQRLSRMQKGINIVNGKKVLF